jgi:hypothetical protein
VKNLSKLFLEYFSVRGEIPTAHLSNNFPKNFLPNRKMEDEKIDKWKIEPFNEGEMKSKLLEDSSFATLFPQYREKYLRSSS